MRKNRIYYFLISVLCLWLMIMYEGAFIEAAFAAIVMLPFLLILIKYITRLAIKSSWSVDGLQVLAGNKIGLNIDLKNNFIFPINRAEIKFVIEDISGNSKECKIVTNFMPFMTRKCAFEIQPNYSGAITVRLVSITIYDYLCLTKTTQKRNSFIKLAVHPITNKIMLEMSPTATNVSEESDTHSTILSGNDKTQIFDISEYHEGDNVKDIHWKLSLKTDQYMVKKYSMPISNEINVFVDFEYNKKYKLTSKGVDGFFTYLFSLVEELEELEGNVNLLLFDSNNLSFYKVGKTDILLGNYNDAAPIETVCQMFKEYIGVGRNILVSSRINGENVNRIEDLAEYYVDLDSEQVDEDEIVIEDIKVIGINPNKKNGNGKDKEFLTITDELKIVFDDNEISIYSNIFRALLIFLGAYVPLAVLFETIAFSALYIKLAMYTVLGIGIMIAVSFISNKLIRYGIVIFSILTMFITTGINSFIAGLTNLINCLGKAESNGYLHFSQGNIDDFLAMLCFIVAIVLFIFTWKSLSILVHLILTVPFVSICFVFGQVPSGFITILFVVYLYAMISYGVTYNNIINREKKILKKSFYESTLNIGSLISFVVGGLVAIIMILDIVKGYTRYDELVEIKTAINTFLDEFDINKYIEKTEEAKGGIGFGKLGEVDSVVYMGDKILDVKVDGNIEFPLYLKSYVGSDYTGNSWEEISDSNNYKIESGLLENSLSLENAFNLSFNVLQEAYLGTIDLTDENIKAAEVVGFPENEYEKISYMPYGSLVFHGGIIRDGIIQNYTLNTKKKLIYQVTRIDNIKKTDSVIPEEENFSYYQWAEKIYCELVKDVYGENFSYYSSAMEELSNEKPNSYYFNNEWVDLSKGPEKIGYEPYIEAVKEYMFENYEYSIKPGRLKDGEDFLGKFMEEKEGYCTYFATMATVMFKMYGIPSRYVEGYYVTPNQEELNDYKENGDVTIVVEDDKAHAWTEIYVDGYGWMPIEVTPGYKGLNYHKAIKGDINTQPEETTTKPKETTTKPKETNTKPTTQTTENKESTSSINLDFNKITKWIIILILFGSFTYVLGRKSYRNKKVEDVINGEDNSLAIKMWEKQLIFAMKSVNAPISLNEHRESLAMDVSKYINEGINNKKKYTFNETVFEKELVEMFAVFDKASFSNSTISNDERKMAEVIVIRAISHIYCNQNLFVKIFLKYIKCLYLK